MTYTEFSFCESINIDSVQAAANDWGRNEVRCLISEADLLVDATTSLDVPRDLSQKPETPRAVSIFITPSGRESVLLLESADNRTRLDGLEAQYYRAIINSDWGIEHLVGHAGNIWVGAGCRDISLILSYEDIIIHAAALAKQVRILRDQPKAKIKVWQSDPEKGTVIVHDIPIHPTYQVDLESWSVVWDEGISEKIRGLRIEHLPSETGGVLVGYIDQKLRKIFVVDALPAPSDSEADRSGFIRGTNGLDATLSAIAARTANIVGYIGEWHSHPEFIPPAPSVWDKLLVKKLAGILALEGLPALMMIVGTAGDISASVGVATHR